MPQAATSADMVRSQMTTAQWLLDPFIRIDGTRALLIGLSVIVASGPAAVLGGLHFDGLPDFTPTYGAPLWVPVRDGLVTWLVFSLLIGLAARVIAPRPVRFVDIAGPQALARFPLLVAALLCALPAMRRANAEMLATVAEGGSIVPPPVWAFFVATFVGFFCGIWMLWLMWKGFSVACKLRGGRAVAVFAAIFVAAQAVSGLLLARTLLPFSPLPLHAASVLCARFLPAALQ